MHPPGETLSEKIPYIDRRRTEILEIPGGRGDAKEKGEE
jgi:hypothetical protein